MTDYWYSAKPHASRDGDIIKRNIYFTDYPEFSVLTGILLSRTFLPKGIMHPGAETTRETIIEISDMKILLASPGTGKTRKVKDLARTDYSGSDILVLSFTNATVNDLKSSLAGIKNVSCYTLHSYALRINHLPSLHVLDSRSETHVIQQYADKLNIAFDDLCSFLRCITFEKMIKECIQFIKSSPAYAPEAIGNVDLLVVDEFQDFNEVERQLIYLLSEYSNETIILGDDDQSIYEFKDADPDGIISVYRDDSVQKMPHDNICHRCPDTIVEYSSKLIRLNRHRVQKPWKKGNNPGDVVFKQKLEQEETWQYLCNEIMMIRSMSNKGTILVLSPVGFCVPQLKETFEKEGIEYIDFWSNKIDPTLREKIWWLKALYGDHKILFLLLLAKTLKLMRKIRFIRTLNDAFRSGHNERNLIEQLVHLDFFPSPFCQYLLATIPISELFEQNPDFSDLREYIDEADLSNSIPSLENNIDPALSFTNDAVNIMSIHKSKGLQADYVFITGLNEGILPNKARGIDTIEAQRRLLFVGMTRALKRLYMISTVEWEGKFVHKVDKSQFLYRYAKKKYHGKTSRFVVEMINSP